MKTLVKSLKILEKVARSPQPVGVRDLARTVGINSTTVHKILSTLESSGYLNNADGKYSLGIRAFLLGNRDDYHRSLYRLCLPHMERLRDALGHAVALTVRAGGDIIGLGVCSPKSGLAVISEPGVAEHAHTMASGRVILADMDDRDRDAYLERHPLVKVTSCTVTDRQRFGQELDNVRERGSAIVRDEGIDGVGALAVPVRDDTGTLVAVLGVMLPSMMMESKTERRLREALFKAVNSIESDLH